MYDRPVDVVVDIDTIEFVDRDMIREEEAESVCDRGGWKIWDFAPESRGAEP